MKNIIFFDSEDYNTLLPLTYTRPVSELRVGMLSIAQKWQRRLNISSSNYTQPHLEALFPMHLTDDNLFILGGLLPTDELTAQLQQLPFDTTLVKDGWILASRGANLHDIKQAKHTLEYNGEIKAIQRPWDIFRLNGEEIEYDLALVRTESEELLPHTTVYGDQNKLVIHPTAKVTGASFNTSSGSIYIGENAEVMEGSLIRGPFALCANSTVKMGAKIYGGTSIGPGCKVGGEVSNAVFQGYSNKGHDGFLGNSVIGEWCNLGADTNSSNLKNNYSNVRVWDYVSHAAVDSGLTFCGLIMGDHSKTGINSMLNTGTLIGVGANVYGANFPPKFIPSFSWGTGVDFSEHNFEKFCSTAERVMARRKMTFSAVHREMLKHVFSATKKFRMS